MEVVIVQNVNPLSKFESNTGKHSPKREVQCFPVVEVVEVVEVLKVENRDCCHQKTHRVAETQVPEEKETQISLVNMQELTPRAEV